MKPLTLAQYFATTDTQLMIMSAFRYALGRQTYITGSYSDYVRRYREYLDNNTRHVIVRDIIEALVRDRAGDPNIDAPVWRDLAALLYREMTALEQASVRNAVRYLGEDAMDTIRGPERQKERKHEHEETKIDP